MEIEILILEVSEQHCDEFHIMDIGSSVLPLVCDYTFSYFFFYISKMKKLDKRVMNMDEYWHS